MFPSENLTISRDYEHQISQSLFLKWINSKKERHFQLRVTELLLWAGHLFCIAWSFPISLCNVRDPVWLRTLMWLWHVLVSQSYSFSLSFTQDLNPCLSPITPTCPGYITDQQEKFLPLCDRGRVKKKVSDLTINPIGIVSKEKVLEIPDKFMITQESRFA